MSRPVILINTFVAVRNERECEMLISQYAQRVWDAGGVPMMVPSIENQEMISDFLKLAHGVLLIGGPDYPPSFYGEEKHPETGTSRMRPYFDVMLAKAVLKTKLPLLGICAGCQLLNIATGGKLIQHLPNADDAHKGGKLHNATIAEDGFFSKGINKCKGDVLTVNSFHHQAVNANALGNDLKITAVAFDGTVEAIEMPGEKMVLGVQFHPERMDDIGPLMFKQLITEASKNLM